MTEHFSGEKIIKRDDPLTLDGLIQDAQDTYKQLSRSFMAANHSGENVEGMEAPIEKFEQDAMFRQLHKHKNIYGSDI